MKREDRLQPLPLLQPGAGPAKAWGGGVHPARKKGKGQEGRRGSEEAVPVPSVFPSGDPGVSGDFLSFLPKKPQG